MLAALVPALPTATAEAANPATLLDYIKAEAEYIMSMRDGQGIITTVPGRTKVVPYQANFGVMGLARAYALTGDSRYAAASWKWLQWYEAHMLADGTMPDWIYQAGEWVPTGSPDSTDSYAGTFISAVLEVFKATHDLQRIEGLVDAVFKAIGAIELTEDDDGLHFAKPGWPFKYSMDEAEAYAGFRAAEELGALLRDPVLETRGRLNAERLLAGSVNLVDPETGLYLWAIHDDGTRVTAPVSWIYPGATAQVWAVADGLATGQAAKDLIARVDAAQPLWDSPLGNAQYYDGHPTCAGIVPCMLRVNYWPRFSLAHLALGNVKRALDGALRIRSGAVYNNRAYPYTPLDAGQLIQVFGDPDVMLASVSPVSLPRVAA
jgi:hypothetical protein